MPSDDTQIISREEVLALLSEQARGGSVTAAVALERALRLDDPDRQESDRFSDQFDELDGLLAARTGPR